MAKLYFKYGAMGAAKSAQALVARFNYEERGMKVWLIKPAVDNRSDLDKVASRIGIYAECEPIEESDDIVALYKAFSKKPDVVIADEAQFFTVAQIDQLRELVDVTDMAVMCFGLRTDFRTRLFPASARLMEVADSIEEIKTMCSCGKKATVNARLDAQGRIVTEGDQVLIGGNDKYQAMCHRCYSEKLEEARRAEQPQVAETCSVSFVTGSDGEEHIHFSPTEEPIEEGLRPTALTDAEIEELMRTGRA